METRLPGVLERLEQEVDVDVSDDVAALYFWADHEGARPRDMSAESREQRAQTRYRAAEQLRLSVSESKATANAVERETAIALAKTDAVAAKMVEQASQERHRVGELRATSAASVGSKASVPNEIADPYPAGWSRQPDEHEARLDKETSRSRTIVDAYLELEDAVWEVALEDDAAALSSEAQIEAQTLPIAAPGAVSDPVPPAVVRDHLHVHELNSDGVRPRARHVQEAEVVMCILGAEGTKGNMLGEESTVTFPTEGALLFERTEHAMSELFEAEPLSKVQRGQANPGNERTPLRNTPVEKESDAARGDLVDIQDERVVGDPKCAGEIPEAAWPDRNEHAPELRHLPSATQGLGDAPESLECTKKRIAARWFTLRRVFGRPDGDASSEHIRAESRERQTPIVALLSVAGGAGKTSLVATLGRALSSLGERVLLSEITSHALLPFYFGTSLPNPGVVRTFLPPPGSTEVPIHLLSYDTDGSESPARVVDALMGNSQRVNRVLLDLSVNSATVVERLGPSKPTILIPLLPDMNSVIGIARTEKLFGSIFSAEGQSLQPIYLLNQFDASLPLHLDIREVLQQQLGERLLPFVIRRSAAVGEALAEGMTILDYDPGSAVADDYLRAAHWLRGISAPVPAGFRNQRWNEQ